MSDLIRRQDAIDTFVKWHLDGIHTQQEEDEMRAIAERAFSYVPSAEPQTARWINGKCSKCFGNAPYHPLSTGYRQSDFCPDCGRKMIPKGATEC